MDVASVPAMTEQTAMKEPTIETPQPVWRPVTPGTGGERELLAAFLDHFRVALRRKAEGLSDADAVRRLVPSQTTVAGVVKHLRWVEYAWFQFRLTETRIEDLDPMLTTDVVDADFLIEPGETLARLLDDYDEQCARSRELAAGYDLDHTVPSNSQRVSLRWIYLHMIEETARHIGQLDVLREQLDGAVGD